MNRLVDAARPESDVARHFQGAVDQLLKNAPKLGSPEEIQATLRRWNDNDKTLRPILENSQRGAEIMPLSQQLSDVAHLGLEAMTFIDSKGKAPAGWAENGRQVLDIAQNPRAEVEIVIVPAVRKLVLAAAQFERLKSMDASEWNKSLDTQVEDSKPKRKE